MLETPHVAVGAAIATKIPNPLLAIPLALMSHIVLDRVPHWNPHFYTETKEHGKPGKKSTQLAVTDIIISLGLGVGIAYSALPNTSHSLIILLASFAAVFPDVAKTPFYFMKQRKGLIKKWVDFERSLQVETTPALGILTQILVILSSLAWIN